MTSQEIAAAVGGACPHPDSVTARQSRIAQPTTISGARLSRLELREVRCRGDLTIANSRIDVLEVTNLELARGAAFGVHDCVIDTIELRSFSGRGATTLQRVRSAAMTIHGIGRVSLLACAGDQTITISRVGSSLVLTDVGCGELVVRDLDDDELVVTITDVSCRRELDLHSGSVLSIAATDTRSDAIRLRRIVTRASVAGVVLAGCGADGDVSVEGLTNLGGLTFRASGLRVGGSLVVGPLDSPATATRIAELDGAFIEGDIRLSAQKPDAPPFAISDTTVAGALRLGALDRSEITPRGIVELRAGSITDMTLPAERIRTRADVVNLANRIFGGTTVDGLAALRVALAAQHRPLDEDAVYSVLQSQLAIDDPRGRWRRLVLGGIFGWGVRLGAPARALAVLILLTSAVVFAAWSSGGFGDRVVNSALRAFGLWTNVDVNLAHDPSSQLYGVLRIGAGGGGIVLITVLVGIVIRKLVR